MRSARWDFPRNRSSGDAVRCSNWARKVRLGTSRVKIREDRVDAALVASRTGVRRGGVLQKHPAITGFTTGRGDRMAQRHVHERERLNACAASAGLGTRTYGHYEVSCSRSADDDGSLSVAARAIASERAADDAPDGTGKAGSKRGKWDKSNVVTTKKAPQLESTSG